MAKIITISREFGSGGRVIGEEVAKRLGISYYDKNILVHVMEKTGFSEKFLENRTEYALGNSIFSYALSARTSAGASIDDEVLQAQADVIRELAEKESFVIIGRSADQILRDRTDVLNVFIYGNMPEKLERIKKLQNLDDKKAAALIKEMDKKRAVNYQYVTDRKWGRRENYDLMLNSSTFGYEACIQTIVTLAGGK